MTNKYEKYLPFANARSNCIACNSPLASNSSKWATDSYFSALICPHCGMIQVEPCLSDIGLTRFYQGYYATRKSNTSLSDQRQIQYKLDYRYVSHFITSGLVLDVGCSDGSFLQSFPNTFDRFGIDIELDPVTTPVPDGISLFSGYFPDTTFFDHMKFDLITFRGVIEHLRDPRSFINKAATCLKPGGLLYFCATPNSLSPAASLFKTRWNQWHPIEHPNLFSVPTLSRMLTPYNFKLLDSCYPYLQTPYAQPDLDFQAFISEVTSPSDQLSPPFWGSMLSAIFSYLP